MPICLCIDIRKDKKFTTSVYHKPVLRAFYRIPISLLKSNHSLLDIFGYAQAGLNYTLNYFL